MVGVTIALVSLLQCSGTPILGFSWHIVHWVVLYIIPSCLAQSVLVHPAPGYMFLFLFFILFYFILYYFSLILYFQPPLSYLVFYGSLARCYTREYIAQMFLCMYIDACAPVYSFMDVFALFLLGLMLFYLLL